MGLPRDMAVNMGTEKKTPLEKQQGASNYEQQQYNLKRFTVF